jgi:hypothetical protein
MRWAHALLALAVSLSLAADSPVSQEGKKNGAKQEPSIKALGLPYKEGSVWSLVFIRTEAGMTSEYLETVAKGWKILVEEMKNEGLILSYKVFLGSATNKNDWDVMLLIEYKNMAVLDGLEEKIQKIADKVLGGAVKIKEDFLARDKLREVHGEKIVRELILK